MEDWRTQIVLGSVGLYMVMCIGVGIWAMRRTKSSKDFFMAGRDLGVMVTALAVFSSTLSGFGFVGGPGLIYRMGMSSFWMVVCSVIGYSMSFFVLAKRIRLFAELRDSVSLPDAVAARYGSELSRFLTALAILLGVVGYLATQILAMAIVLQDIVPEVAWLTGVNDSIVAIVRFVVDILHLPIEVRDDGLEVFVVLSCGVLVFYCVTGGIIASVYTDLVQGFIMMIAAVLVFFAARSALDGGFAEISRTIMADDAEAMGPWGSLGMLGCLSWLFLFGLGGMGQPHVITKMMMTRRVEDARHILPVTLAGYTLSALLWLSIGLVMRALVLQGAHPALGDSNAAASQFLQNYAHPLLAGVVFAGLFAAIMSTADGFLNIGTAAVVHDIPKAIRGRSLPHELFWARIVTVVIAVFAAFFALYSGESLIALLGAFGWGTFAAALVPTVAIGFNWKRATATAANVAIAASLTITFGFKILGVSIPYGIDGGAISLLVSLILFFTISLASKPPSLEPDVDAVMDL